VQSYNTCPVNDLYASPEPTVPSSDYKVKEYGNSTNLVYQSKGEGIPLVLLSYFPNRPCVDPYELYFELRDYGNIDNVFAQPDHCHYDIEGGVQS